MCIRDREEIYKLFEDEEKYAINDDDIHNAELKIDDASGSVNVEKLEEDIREAKFNQIYKDFSSSAFAVAQKDHAVHYDRIMASFENALKVNKKSANYDEIHSAIGGFVQKYKKNIEDDFIYQSVIERFVRDVVEVLIRRPYSSCLLYTSQKCVPAFPHSLQVSHFYYPKDLKYPDAPYSRTCFYLFHQVLRKQTYIHFLKVTDMCKSCLLYTSRCV